MRVIPLSAVVVMLAGGVVSAGQVTRDIRYVSVEAAEVRSGPSQSPELYATNRLRKGTPVEVTADRLDGWLEIRPPAGSFSYISTLFLSHPYTDQPNYVVVHDGVTVPVYIGSEIENKKPTVVGVNLQKGSLVVSKGRVVNKEGSWMPIVPPDRERRYILASAVTKVPPGSAQLASAAHSTFTPVAGNLTVSQAPSANLAAGSADQMWQRAIAAERAGQVQEAIRLYAQVGADMVSTRPELSTWALQRASYLGSGYRTYGVATPVGQQVPMVPAGNITPVSRASGAVAVGSAAPPQPPPAVPAYSAPQGSSFVPAPAGSPPRVANAAWVGYRGVLRRSGRSVEGYQTYVIDDPLTLRPLVEVMPGRGMNLEAQLLRNVQVYGYTWYRGDLRRNFMNAVYLMP